MAVQIKKPKAIEEIIVKGKKTTTSFNPGAFARTEFSSEALRGRVEGLTRADFVLGKERAAALDDMLRRSALEEVKRKKGIVEEIVVKAKRLPKPPIGFVNAFAGPFLFAADIGAQLADVISQKRLDEAGRIATLTDPPKPDTPVATIAPEVIDEIVVTAKRPIQKVVPSPSNLIDQEWIFRETFPRVGAGADRPKQPKAPVISKPKIARKQPKQPLIIPSIIGGPGTGSLVEPLPRSLALGIGKPKLGAAIGTGLAVGGMGALMPQTQPGSAGGCQPCPKPKKKKRTKCYRGLIKQRRDASRDKISKWAVIDCDTGRTIKELI